MISIQHSSKGTPFVWASDLRNELEIKTRLNDWFPRMIEYGFVENEDYAKLSRYVAGSNGAKTHVFDWAVQLDMAKHVSMIQRSERGKALRTYLIHLDKKVEEGLLLSREQISALFEICKVMGFFSVQKFFEAEHYNALSQPRDWWEYRARLFGYGAEDLKDMMKALGKRYSTQRQALMHIDKYELIRIAVCDLFIAMGKNEEFSRNVSDFAKVMAEEMRPDVYNDINMSIDFKSDKQRSIIEDLKSYKNGSSSVDKFFKPNKSTALPAKGKSLRDA